MEGEEDFGKGREGSVKGRECTRTGKGEGTKMKEGYCAGRERDAKKGRDGNIQGNER